MRQNPADVRVVQLMNPLPMHDQAFAAAEMALAAHAQGKYWEAEAKLFENARDLGPGSLERIAREIGLDVAQFHRAMQRHEQRDAIQRQQGLAARLGVRSTPVFFVNGRKLPGAVPFERFKARIDEEIARVREVIRTAGVPRELVYEHLTRDGAESIRTVSTERPLAPAIPGRPAIRQLSLPRPQLRVEDVPERPEGRTSKDGAPRHGVGVREVTNEEPGKREGGRRNP